MSEWRKCVFAGIEFAEQAHPDNLERMCTLTHVVGRIVRQTTCASCPIPALSARADAAEAKVTALEGAGDGLLEGLDDYWVTIPEGIQAKAAWTKAKGGSDEGRG